MASFELRAVLTSPDLIGLGGFTPVRQSERHFGAAACVVACLRFWGLHANEYQCVETMGANPVTGTPIPDILKYLAGQQLYATAWKNYPVRRIVERVTQGKLVLISVPDWGGHWVVAVGYDSASDSLVIADPSLEKTMFRALTLDQWTQEWAGPCVAIDIDRPSATSKVRVGTKSRYDKRTDFRIHDWNKPAFVKQRAASRT